MIKQIIPPCQGVLYTVRSGDTLYLIAQRNNISVQELINANPQITDPSRIIPGQVICIPAQQPSCPGVFYTVQAGDNLNAIAVRFGVSVEQILAVNPAITNPNVIFVGQSICIPTPQPVEECAIVLSLSGAAVPALPPIAGGVVLIQRTNGEYALTFAATGLPEPATIGNFDAYLGSVNINGQVYSALLSRSAPFGQEPTWAGTRVITVNPFAVPQSTVTIAPFNTQTGVRTNPVMGGTVSQCRR
ncbi:MAG TPA: LysM peptidoglycan-binding domain-containing protein [Bacillota bacterium]|jgi:LysM repeat protein|nr:LysM peptidoglycan-binding domain-containing protein [Bacillota bacterium]HPT68427.1 LysM peptidoglycan-binding domain-containing protein [Bacillota bacterium]